MSIDPDALVGTIVVGIGATLVMDLWNLSLRRFFGIVSLDYCLLGRWISHMPAGRLRHASIVAADAKPFECVIGWVSHYSIGIVFALGLVALTAGESLSRPTLWPALLYGIGTVIFPFFIMQPSLGFGVAASRTPKPSQARLKSLATHTVFGVALYLCAIAYAHG